MATDFLNNPQRNPRIAHLGQGRSLKAVGGCALDAGVIERGVA